MRLDDSTIAVTGASMGLGRAMADAFVAEGANVVYSSHEPERTAAAVRESTDRDVPGRAMAVTADVRNWEDAKSLARRAGEAFGGVDVMVNNAGVNQYKVNHDHVRQPVRDIPIETWDTILDTNLRGVFLCSKAVLPGMLDRDAGRLIHISSGHGFRGRANRAAYSASKFGLEGFHESLAHELEGTGVDSLAFRPPGSTYTQSSRLKDEAPEDHNNESPTVIAEAAVQLAAGAGENGGRYVATPDGKGFDTYTRTGDQAR